MSNHHRRIALRFIVEVFKKWYWNLNMITFFFLSSLLKKYCQTIFIKKGEKLLLSILIMIFLMTVFICSSFLCWLIPSEVSRTFTVLVSLLISILSQYLFILSSPNLFQVQISFYSFIFWVSRILKSFVLRIRKYWIWHLLCKLNSKNLYC